MHIRPLPLAVRFVAGESTGSYVTRLAARNGLTVRRLLDGLGEGRSAPDVDPRYTELYMNREARARLALLVARSVEELVRALPSTGEEHLLPDEGGPVWRWPWAPHGGYLVRGCALCSAARETSAPVWLMRPDPWHICVRHGRFSDHSRDDHVPFIDLSPGPHVVEAERQRQNLVRRLGPVGRALMADAFAVLTHETVGFPRLGGHRTAPLRLLAPAVEIAHAMASFERRRLGGRMFLGGHKRWADQAAVQFGPAVGRNLGMWAASHQIHLVPLPRPGPGTWLPLTSPHEQVGGMQSMDEITCLRWGIWMVGERPYG
ncbi:TniQ family protein [Streptomyces californicus]|uniref:TniQ family protein n=1 Tax=Streptomyces californicus TaxID=67351 RepID=UPI0036DC8504